MTDQQPPQDQQATTDTGGGVGPLDPNMAGACELIQAILCNQPIWPNPWGQDVAAAAFLLTENGSRPTSRPAPSTPCCRWTLSASDSYWDTGCGHAFEFYDGSPPENDFRFCPYCGRALSVVDDERHTGPGVGEC